MKNHFNLDCASDQIVLSSQEEEQRHARKKLIHSNRFKVRSSSQHTLKLRPNEFGAGFSFLLTLYVEGRKVIGAEADVGFLHQGIEKSMESRSMADGVALLTRFSSEQGTSMSVAFEIAVEKLSDAAPSGRTRLERIITLEAERIHHHTSVMAHVYELVGDSSERSLRMRLSGLSRVDRSVAVSQGLSGITLRAAGFADDLRYASSELPYELLGFRAAVRQEADAFGRFMLRKTEIDNSKNLIERARGLLKTEPEEDAEIIYSPSTPRVMSQSVEAAEGELSVTVCGDGSEKPVRVRIKTPSFAHLSAISTYLTGADIDDVLLILSTLGIDSLEVDR